MNDSSVAPLDPLAYRELVRAALAEDVGSGDITTAGTIGSTQRARGRVVTKSPCVVAGIDIATETFRQLDPDVVVNVLRHDGAACAPGDVVVTYEGLAAALLTGERTALNVMQRLSGIATLTRKFVDAAGGALIVLDTRKTTPLLRAIEKYAVRAGGGVNHRSGLDRAVLIKDNHIALAGGLVRAVGLMREAQPTAPIEVEAQSLDEVDAALSMQVDVILLDNLTVRDAAEAVRRCRGRARTEISGGVTLDRMPELAALGVDSVSVGALTHSAPAADISLDIEPA